MYLNKAFFHLPGLFEFFDFYSVFIPLFYEHPEYFYENAEIASVYGAPPDCIWAGGRTESGQNSYTDIIRLLNHYSISPRLTLSNSLLTEKHLTDKRCNSLCDFFEKYSSAPVGIVIYSDILLNYLKEHFSTFYFVSSTTKVLTGFDKFHAEAARLDFSYIVPDFRLNHDFDNLKSLTPQIKKKVEFLVNECCDFSCKERKACYENVCSRILGINVPEHMCSSQFAGMGYRFSLAMKNPGFISREDINNIYLPLGFSNFKIEGRGLGSAVLLEFILYYMTKPEYHLKVREEIYLDSMLDLF